MRTVPMFASPVVYTRRRTLADQLNTELRRTHCGTRHFFLRDLTAQHDAQHPCWTATHFLPYTRPPDVMRPHRSSNRATYGPSERRAYALTRSGFQTMPRRDEDAVTEVAASATARGPRAPRFGARARAAMLTPPAPERPSTPADLRTALRPLSSFGVPLFAINVGCPADRPRPPSRIHSEDHIISQRFSPPSTGCISGGHTSLPLYW